MTRTLTFTKAHLLSALHDQLIAAGYHPAPVVGEDPARPYRIELGFPDDFADDAGVAAVVAAHDRAAATAAWQAARDAETQEYSQAAGLLGQLDDAIATAQGAGTLTAAQVKAGLLLALRGVRLIVRYELRRRGA